MYLSSYVIRYPSHLLPKDARAIILHHAKKLWENRDTLVKEYDYIDWEDLANEVVDRLLEFVDFPESFPSSVDEPLEILLTILATYTSIAQLESKEVWPC